MMIKRVNRKDLEQVVDLCKMEIECDIETEAGGGWVYFNDVGNMSLETFEVCIQWIDENSKLTGIALDMWEDAGTNDFGVWMYYTHEGANTFTVDEVGVIA